MPPEALGARALGERELELTLEQPAPYFLEQPSIRDDADLDKRMRNGELSLALEIPADFAADLQRGRPTSIGVWVDGAMPQRAETIEGPSAVQMHIELFKRLQNTQQDIAKKENFFFERSICISQFFFSILSFII